MMLALSNRLRLETGMKLAHDAIEHAVRRRMREVGEANLNAYALHALNDEGEMSILVDQIVVPETWFFRDADAFSAAANFVAQLMRNGRRPARLLSIPCATGEEPYSMAIALAEAGIAPGEVILEAIDVSRGALERARLGVYQRNAFRTSDLGFRDKYFHRGDHGYELHQEIRAAVRFRCANLLTLEASAPGEQFDVIFCRNLLIYFDEAAQRNAAARLKSLLRDDGLLLSGYAETNAFIQHGFAAAPYPRAFALTKAAASTANANANANTSANAPLATASGHLQRKRALPPASPPHAPRSPQILQPPTMLQTPQPAMASQPDGGLKAILRQARETADAGDRQGAERLYQRCLQLAPDCAEAYFMLGLLLERQHDARAAAEHLRRAVYLEPDHYEALCHLALLAEQDGDADAARQFRQRAARVFERRSGTRGKS
ncbi:CheR family methyltransferase [Noviherbaspirillum aerium]|uniref:CheR family methyltransferase n=1 Tax=Noviherbaspirillum aerium TaxID=2588497 RepID=UPI00124BF734|nr:protein-glutamate O-methyltransferase CheR [Noviherbaspirillum aerium]